MQIPADLRERILEACDSVPRRELAAAAEDLSRSYRALEKPPARRMTRVQALAYAATRMPATYSALRRVLREIPAGAVSTALDIGAGTGAGAWALLDELGVSGVWCEERDAEMRGLGERLSYGRWTADASTAGKPDVILLSYVIGEVEDPLAFARAAFERCGKYLVVLEPGTPRGFARIAALRQLGAILAPCPGSFACPMESAGDWCHFSARVERSALHKQLKGGELSYEDEKFSYVILAQDGAAAQAQARVVRHPESDKGRIRLRVCEEGVVRAVEVHKRTDAAGFKLARKAEWGDRW